MSLNVTRQKQIDQLHQELSASNKTCLGYPLSRDFDYSPLYDFFKYSINNIGDPFEAGTIKTNTHNIEREVVGFFGDLLGANPKDYWGYVTHCGSESNLYSLYVARELYKDGIVYYSEMTHYCVKKSIKMLNMESVMIRSKENGEIDYQDLENTLRQNRSKPVIIVANFGTTLTESKDDISIIKGIFEKLAIQDTYIHCDAALSGAYGAFIEPRTPFDLSDGADSISVSGHKFIGSPMPSGVLLTKRSLRNRVARHIEVIDTMDSTIAGSRNGHTSLFLWYAIQKLGTEGLKKRYQYCLSISNYCLERLKAVGIEAWKIQGAITVMFPKVSPAIKTKWQIATVGNLSHVVCMPYLNKEQVDVFVEDLVQDKESNLEKELITSA